MANVIGMNEVETRRLLLELGARGSETDGELWMLLSNNPLKEIDESKAADGPSFS